MLFTIIICLVGNIYIQFLMTSVYALLLDLNRHRTNRIFLKWINDKGRYIKGVSYNNNVK